MTGKNLHTDSSLRAWTAIFSVIVLMISAGGYWYYREEAKKTHQEAYQELSTIGRLKAGQIQQWWKERLGDINEEVKSPFMAKAIVELVRGTATPDLRAELRENLSVVAMAYNYSDALLLDPDGNILLAVKDAPDPVDAATRRAIEEAITSREAVLSDFFRSPNGIVHIDVVAVVPGTAGEPLAVVILRSNPEANLYPMIHSWPTLSPSAETLIVQREGEEVVFLNELRHKAKTALSLREPLARTNLPAVQAVLGKQGMFEGKDYRGVEVLAELLPIPGSSWFMVAKVDTDEIFAEARYRAGVIAVIVGSFILLAAAATAYVYRRGQAGLFRDLYESERRQLEIQQIFRMTLYGIGDAVITTDSGGRVRVMNPVAETLSGWREEEAWGKPLEETFRIVNEETHASVENPVQRVLRDGAVVGLANHSLLIARDGTERPIADSAAPIRDENGSVTGVVLVFRDQTEERIAHRVLAESEERLRMANEAARIGTYTANLETDKVFWSPELCDIVGVPPGIERTHEEAYKIVHKDDLLRVLDISRRGDATFVSEHRVVRPDGQVRWVLWRGRTLFRETDSGRIPSMRVGACVDITERKRAEAEFRTLSSRQEAILAAVPEIIMEVDGNKIYTWANRAGVEFFGDDVIGKQAALYFEGEQDVYGTVQSLFNGDEKVFYVESWQRRRDGQKRLLAWWCRVLKNAQGTITGALSTAHDITDLRQAEEELRESEARFRALVESAPEAIFVQSAGRFAYLNSAARRLFGAWQPEDLLGKDFMERIAPEYRDKIRERIRLQSETGKPSPLMEQEYLRLDGARVPVETTAVAIRYRGEDAHMVFIRDITERKQAEEALRETESKYRRLHDSMVDAFVSTDMSGRIQETNRAFQTLLGYTEEKLKQLNYTDLTPEKWHAFEIGIVKNQIIPRGYSEVYEKEYRKKDGTIFPVELRTFLLRDASGQPIGMWAIIRDITERKLADEKLRETEKKYRELAESLPEVIFEVDLNGILTYVNQTGRQLFGYTPEELAKDFNVLEAFIPEDRERVAQDIMLNLQGKRLGRQDYTALRKDGTRFPAGVHAGRVMRRQTATGVRGILIDLTETQRADAEKKKLEDQLRQAQKMEAIGSLAGGIAHDFNNILSVIIGNAEMLQISEVSSEAKNGLHQIFNASQRAKQLIHQILAFSRQGEHQKMLMSLKPMVKETIGFLRASLPSTIQLQHYIKPDAGAILADSTQMQQVLMNLCTNAAHAMEEAGGVLKIKLDTATIAEEDLRLDPEAEPGDYVRLTVLDTGHGIEPGVLDRIFDPYFTTKGPEKGTGLGLAVVHGIVKSHGGIIRVYSDVGKGTVFHVLLPRADEAVKREEKPAQPLPTGNERILVVDDEKPLADVYQQLLEMLGYQAETRTSPVEALEAVRMNPQKYDLVITDMTMPQMTGYNLAKRLMEIIPGLPVILCTGFSDQINDEKARSVGILALLFKPVLLHDLANSLRKVLDETHKKKSS